MIFHSFVNAFVYLLFVLVDREDTPVQAPTPSTTSSSSSSSSQSADGEERPKARTIDEIKAKYGRPSTSSTLDALQQAKQVCFYSFLFLYMYNVYFAMWVNIDDLGNIGT